MRLARNVMSWAGKGPGGGVQTQEEMGGLRGENSRAKTSRAALRMGPPPLVASQTRERHNLTRHRLRIAWDHPRFGGQPRMTSGLTPHIAQAAHAWDLPLWWHFWGRAERGAWGWPGLVQQLKKNFLVAPARGTGFESTLGAEKGRMAIRARGHRSTT